MDIIQAIILGAIQGLTEFIPISSSAHLVILPWLFHWKTPGLLFDVSLHLGTLIALLAFFWREWYNTAKASISERKGKLPAGRSFFVPLIFACVPAGIAGISFEGAVEHIFRNPACIGTAMIGLGIILFIADRYGRKQRSIDSITIRDWIIIGLAQAFAIIPGVSRSGITITAGLFCGLQRETAAKFSFLIGAPIIFGAAVYELRKIFEHGLPGDQVVPFITGVLTAAIVGYLCIGFLLAYLKKRSAVIFVAYRVVFGIGVIAMYLLR